MGHVLSPSASAAIIRFSQARDVLFIAHFNKSCRNTGGIPTVFHKFTSRKIAHLTAPNMPNGPGMNRIRPIFAVRSSSRILASLKPLLRIHSNWACDVAASDPMSATATTSADAVAAGICPMQRFAAVAFLGDDSTQKNRYGCELKLEGAWRAASRICSRSAWGISTGANALTARLWKSTSRMLFMDSPLCCHYNIVMLQMQHTKHCRAVNGARGGFKRAVDSVEFVSIPRRENHAQVPSHRNSHYGSEAGRDPLEAPETLCRQPREKRIWRGVDAFRSGRGGP